MRTLDKALKILNLFVETKPEMTISEISKLSGMNKPTVWRITTTLVKYGYLIQQKKRGKYFLGTIFISFNRVLTSNLYLRNVIIPYLYQLSEQINEPVTLAYRSGLEDLYPETIGFNVSNKLEVAKTDNRLPLNATSVGKIFLADLTEKELESYFKNKSVKQCTPNTIVDFDIMKKHLMNVKNTEVAFDDEEWGLGIRGVAAGIKDESGKIVAAIGTAIPSVRLTYTKMQEMADIFKNCADVISKNLGFKPSHS
jgi:IclR family transcriptional regulator, KDG regulon repressor